MAAESGQSRTLRGHHCKPVAVQSPSPDIWGEKNERTGRQGSCCPISSAARSVGNLTAKEWKMTLTTERSNFDSVRGYSKARMMMTCLTRVIHSSTQQLDAQGSKSPDKTALPEAQKTSLVEVRVASELAATLHTEQPSAQPGFSSLAVIQLLRSCKFHDASELLVRLGNMRLLEWDHDQVTRPSRGRAEQSNDSFRLDRDGR
ncbi:hypothetical protein F5I97DRAFT_1832124 [Phlebopus sp. FC_14]|nr:hypothetical protein F5I97DRAFT_1832124 [Phlebopus sp. FC_14]